MALRLVRITADQMLGCDRSSAMSLQQFRYSVARTLGEVQDGRISQVEAPAKLNVGGRHVSDRERRPVRGTRVPREHPASTASDVGAVFRSIHT